MPASQGQVSILRAPVCVVKMLDMEEGDPERAGVEKDPRHFTPESNKEDKITNTDTLGAWSYLRVHL